jgi:uncharacterized protein
LEYEQSRFCRVCGSFLLRNFRDERYAQTIAQKAFGNQTNPFKPDSSFEEKIALTRAAESLRNRIARSKEYEVINDMENKDEYSEDSAEHWIWSGEQDQALILEKKLIKQYNGKNLEDAIAGKTISNQQGECYHISASCTSTFKTAPYQESRQLIISDLKALPGIGPAREKTLKKQGYKTIEDLENHLLWRKPARDFMKIINKNDVEQIQKKLWQRFPKSHPSQHYLAGFCQDHDFAIVDIETLGLSERPIILLGIAKPTKTQVCTSQFLLRDIQDEPGAIWALISQLEPNLSLITYNGRGFDIPYIRQRLAYYGLDAPMDNLHFDLLHFTRRALRSKLSDCKLETVEKYLGIKRDINIPGALVPHFYDTYLRTKNPGPLVAIVEHNRQDLLTLGTLFSKLYEEWNL